MKVKQAKLAQTLRGETSNIVEEKKYSLEFDKGMLTCKLLHNPKNLGPFIVFPANIAYLEVHEENTQSDSADAEKTLVSKAKPKK